jgi:hypothetical protein
MQFVGECEYYEKRNKKVSQIFPKYIYFYFGIFISSGHFILQWYSTGDSKVWKENAANLKKGNFLFKVVNLKLLIF